MTSYLRPQRLALGMLLVHVAWAVSHADQVASSVNAKGVPVEIVKVVKSTISDLVYGQGTARAIRREFLSFEAEGKVTYLRKGPGGRDLAAGDHVEGPEEGNENGELLASLDSRDSLAQLEIARASLLQAQKQRVAADTDLDRAKADQQVAEADLQRMRSLVKKQAISRADLEKAQAKASQAEASVKAAKAAVETADSVVVAAQAQVKQAQLALERTSIFATIDGVIAFLNVKEGQYFSPKNINTSSEENALKTVPIVVIDPEEIEVVLDLPTFQASRVKPGQEVFVFTGETLGKVEMAGMTPDEARQHAIVGKVFSVSPSVNPGGRSVQVKVRAKPDDRPIRDGMFVNCWLVREQREDALVIPYNTLLHEGRNKYVFVLSAQGDAVERREVKLGIRGLRGVQIVKGLAAGEQIVGKGRNRLTNGTAVNVVAQREAQVQ